jgi:hypothetical protein
MSEPKSAYELAMERLRQQDADTGIAPVTLSEDQKQEIADVRRAADAKIAQEEILHTAALARTFDPAERATLEENYRRMRARYTDERDAKIETIRRRSSS